MFFIKKFKEWWDILDFRNNVVDIVKEAPDVKKNIISFFFVVLVLSFVLSLWKSFSSKFMIGNLIFNTIRDTIVYLIEILLAGLLIYFVLKYIFKKNILLSNFLSPYFRIETALWGVVAWLFSFLTAVIFIIVGIVFLITVITQNANILLSLWILAIASMPLFIVLIFLVLIWVVISAILQIRLIKNVFKIGGFASFIILIIAGIIIGLILSPVSKIEAPDSVNEISIGYGGLFDSIKNEEQNTALNEIQDENNPDDYLIRTPLSGN